MRHNAQLFSDFLVIGGGIAGLTFALKASEVGSVTVLTKAGSSEANTSYAQGGIASVWSVDDSFESHIEDTIRAGAGLCDRDAVETIVREGPEAVRELIRLGTRFTRVEDGAQESNEVSNEFDTELEYDLGQEGGHSHRRVLHAQDLTGREIMRALTQAAASRPNIRTLENHVAINLLVETPAAGKPGACWGVYALDRNTHEIRKVISRATMLATGGAGKVYLYTTNPDIATGDGVAMAYRAGAAIANMEFIQFHPTCLYHPAAKSFLISEAVRGEGGILKTMAGREFMDDYHPLKSLAPRDIVARAIDSEMKKSGADHVLLDIRHKPADFITERFPNIYQTCLRYGIDITKEPIPVVPAAHYQCGGVQTNVNGETGIDGLYAVGEVACTGLHGANRLASNSLLEALVCAHRAALKVIAHPLPEVEATIPPWQSGHATNADELVVVSHNWEEIRRVMWDYVGIVRTNKRLQRAQKRITNLQQEILDYYWDFIVKADLLELRNIATVAELIITSALQRPESRGLNYNLDYPSPNPEWAQRDTVLRR